MPRASKTEDTESKTEKKEKKKEITNISDLPGIGPTTAKKLEDAGYITLESIATASLAELSELSSLGEKTAAKIVEVARHSLELDFSTADIILEARKKINRITTGSTALDGLFGGGIETRGITELFGEYRTGKTQIALQLAVTTQLPIEEGGLLKDADDPVKILWVDSEGTFRPERIVSMCERYPDLDSNQTLKNIIVGRAYNSDHQIILAEEGAKKAQRENICLVVIDSLIAHFRAEYVGRGTLATRQQKLNRHIHTVLRAAEISNMAVVVTNQVHAKPDTFFGDPNKPVGGHIVAHAATTRVGLRKGKGTRRIARIVDSPLLPESEAVFAITEQGIFDE
ncbi:MAG: DNA repair and recombination protein RadA [Candidatus Hodarchaeota archaeon]